MLKWVAAVVITAIPAAAEVTDCQTITIYVRGSELPGKKILAQVGTMVDSMFAPAGLKVAWNTGEPPQYGDSCGPTIVLQFAGGELYAAAPHALAYAEPFTSNINEIRVFWDKLRKLQYEGLAPLDVLLAHVVVHETTHILQFSAVHAASGLMRARWTPNDYYQMRREPLPLTSVDIQRIRNGMVYRPAQARETSLPANRLPQTAVSAGPGPR